jgi:hypothetical protein
LIVAEFADPARLAAQGVTRYPRSAAWAAAHAATRDALPSRRGVACRVLALLTSLDAQVADAEAEVTRPLPTSL